MDKRVDHHVWKGYCIRGKWDDLTDEILAADKETAMKITAENAGISNQGWEENTQTDYPLFQIKDSHYHAVTVVRQPVYGGSDE